MKLFEMEGFLRGKCIPRDLKVNETNAEYLVRKFAEADAMCAALAAENAGLKDFVKTCFRAAADGASLDGADIQELGERLGLFGRETYQPALHGYICGHEAGEDTVYVMKKTPATDAFLAEVRASELDSLAGVAETMLVKFANQGVSDIPESKGWEMIFKQASQRAAQLRKGVQS
ncbi:hypothetical protein ABHD31_16450 [Enterobacter cloacae]|uniref:hypothetical protein n=1 Tax=Enterobacter cloacae TaxID=550 RepID=UPI00325B78CC